MKKLYSLLVLTLCLLAGLSANAQTVVFDFAANPWQHELGSGSGESAALGNMVDPIAAEADGYSVEMSFEQGSAQQPIRMWTGPQLRVYNGNSFTLKPVDSGKAIVGVTFTAAGASNFGLTTTAGTLDGTAWTGNHTEVTFTGTKTNRLTAISVELADVNAQTVSPGANVTMPIISPRNNTNRTDSVTVSITGDSTTTIYYTLDGTDPTDSSTPYAGPFTLFESATVKAVAYNAEGAKSAVAEVTYTITAGEQPGEQTDTTATDTTTGGKEYLFTRATEIVSGSQYLIVANVDSVLYVAKPISTNYGYLKVDQASVVNDTIVLNNLDNAFIFTAQAAEAGGSVYTITQSDGRLVYQTGTYNSFNVSDEPADGRYWDVALANMGWTITNISVNKYVQYSTSHTSFGSYANEQGLLPHLYVFSGVREVGGSGEQTDTTATDTTVVNPDYETVTFPFSQNPWNLETGSQGNDKVGGVTEPITEGAVTFSTDNGGGSTVVRMWDSNGNITLRTYRGTAITFAVQAEALAIYRIEFEANGMNYTSEIGQIDATQKTWSGNATSVTLAANATTQVKTVTVYLGERNAETVVPGVYVAAPVISPGGGEKKDSVTVSIKAGEGAYIFYTVDGSEPDWNSTRYADSFKLYESATVKAIAYDDEGNPSTVTEVTYTIVISEQTDTTATDTTATEGVIFSDAATSSQNDLIVENVVLPDQMTYIWRFDSKYGAVASGYDAANKQNLPAEAVLKTPILSIPALDAADPEAKPALSFDHAIGYVSAAAASGYMELKARALDEPTATTRALKAGEWVVLPLTFPDLKEGKNFSDFAEVEVDLSEFAGRDIEIGFFYKSDAEVAPTWEVRNIEVTCRKKEATAIEALTIQPAAQAAAVYDLQGRRVSNPSRGVYIVGGRKVYIK